MDFHIQNTTQTLNNYNKNLKECSSSFECSLDEDLNKCILNAEQFIDQNLSIYDEGINTIEELEKIAFTTNEFIQNSSGIIVTEYCKKEETWNKYKAIKHQLNEEFINDLISKEFYEEKMKSSQKDKKVENELNKERIIYEKPPHYWEGLIRQGKERNLLSTMEIDIMSMILTFNTSRPKFPSPKQIKIILAAREKLEKNGVLV